MKERELEIRRLIAQMAAQLLASGSEGCSTNIDPWVVREHVVFATHIWREALHVSLEDDSE